MADSQGWGTSPQVSHSAVVDLEDTEMEIIDDTSDYESHFDDGAGRQRKEAGSSYMEETTRRIGSNMTEAVFEAGRQQAKKAWSVYGNIDILRPFFDVEPKEVTKRLLFSLIPSMPSSQRQRVPRELYGPLMVIFTMIALLLFQMKTSGHKVEEGTLMGTAFGVCFTYWFGASAFIWFLCYVCNTRLAFVQILSMVGYALFGHCVVLFMGTLVHTSHDHVFFYVLWAILGGLSSLRMASLVISRTSGKTQRMIVCGVLALLHLLFLLYLHFAYHQIVEELSEAFNDHNALKPQVPVVVDEASNEKIKDLIKDNPADMKVVGEGESLVKSPNGVETNVRQAMVAVQNNNNNNTLLTGAKHIKKLSLRQNPGNRSQLKIPEKL